MQKYEEKTKKKRERLNNWSEEHKAVLRELCLDRKAVLESSKNDIDTIKQKNRMWGEVSGLLAVHGLSAPANRCKEMWARMKLAAKRARASYKHESCTTGGGSKPNSPSIEDMAMAAIDDSYEDQACNDGDMEMLFNDLTPENEIEVETATENIHSKPDLSFASESNTPAKLNPKIGECKSRRRGYAVSSTNAKHRLEATMVSQRIEQIRTEASENKERREVQLKYEYLKLQILEQEWQLNKKAKDEEIKNNARIAKAKIEAMNKKKNIII